MLRRRSRIVDGVGSREIVSARDNAPYMALDWAHDGFAFARQNGVSKAQLPIRDPQSDRASYRWSTDGRGRTVLADRGTYAWGRSTVHHEHGHAVHIGLIGYGTPDSGN